MDPYIIPPSRRRFFWNVILFLITVLTTILAGALQEGVNPLENLGGIVKGIPFSLSLMGILLAHELGHFLIARRHGLDVTLPYFIPAPSIIGTFGAFIKMRSPIRDRKILLDIGVAGPLVGVAVAIPLLILGLHLSEVKAIQGQSGATLGSSPRRL
ncbi:MAG: site-2 protease family protein [Deltaproteobacteria bacterium]|nr:site-2 protease family protein [Deltaproteobacteria bacterium]